MSPLGLVGAVLNSIAAIIMLVPFLFVFSEGKFKRKTKERISGISATRYDENTFLAEELLLARNCSFLALPLLIFGTLLLLI
jgi:hypothetical protein